MLFLFSGGLGREVQILSKRASMIIMSKHRNCSGEDIQGPVVSINTSIMPTSFKTFHQQDLKMTGSAMTYDTSLFHQQFRSDMVQ
jgi:hypothetical protein